MHLMIPHTLPTENNFTVLALPRLDRHTFTNDTLKILDNISQGSHLIFKEIIIVRVLLLRRALPILLAFLRIINIDLIDKNLRLMDSLHHFVQVVYAEFDSAFLVVTPAVAHVIMLSVYLIPLSYCHLGIYPCSLYNRVKK